MSLRAIADQFALRIVGGKYQEAYEMLSKAAKEEWSPASLKDEFEGMYDNIELAEPTVVTEWNDISGTHDLENGTMLYVPIESNDPWSEAITVIIDGTNEIIGVEFGRP